MWCGYCACGIEWLLATCLTYTVAQQNQYLPPDKGYSYDKPAAAFPSAPRPAQQPAPRPAPRPSASKPSYDSPDHVHEPGMPFDFQYQVKDQPTQNDYYHKANSDGDVTRGEYRVALPDGRTQVVRYTADWKNGYNAEVSYEGEARYPDGPQGAASQGGYRY